MNQNFKKVMDMLAEIKGAFHKKEASNFEQATLVDGGTTHHLWQENKFAVRVEKFITWAKRRPIAAAFLNYATGG